MIVIIQLLFIYCWWKACCKRAQIKKKKKSFIGILCVVGGRGRRRWRQRQTICGVSFVVLLCALIASKPESDRTLLHGSGTIESVRKRARVVTQKIHFQFVALLMHLCRISRITLSCKSHWQFSGLLSVHWCGFHLFNFSIYVNFVQKCYCWDVVTQWAHNMKSDTKIRNSLHTFCVAVHNCGFFKFVVKYLMRICENTMALIACQRFALIAYKTILTYDEDSGTFKMCRHRINKNEYGVNAKVVVFNPIKCHGDIYYWIFLYCNQLLLMIS